MNVWKTLQDTASMSPTLTLVLQRRRSTDIRQSALSASVDAMMKRDWRARPRVRILSGAPVPYKSGNSVRQFASRDGGGKGCPRSTDDGIFGIDPDFRHEAMHIAALNWLWSLQK
ncbi:MAG: hypothetical protein ACREHF_13935, partial [Rhizomicrobium sp.]